ncbi:MAG TPA: substrate-binding domain-containing protein [Reyranella sp.]|nr:substrate-binding domain-containing protein [Reyranella sp.]
MRRLLLGLCLLLACVADASAANLKLITAAGFRPAARELIATFEKNTGHKVTVFTDTTSALMKRLQSGGETFDVIVLPDAAMDSLAGTNTLIDDSIVPLAKGGFGIAVSLSAPPPAIYSAEVVRRTLLQAHAVAYIDPIMGGPTGAYVVKLFQMMGIEPEIRRKSVLVRSGLVGERVARGDADVAIDQVSELRQVPGIRFAGNMPANLQSYTTYAGAISAKSKERDAAIALIAAFTDPAAEDVLKRRGLELP